MAVDTTYEVNAKLTLQGKFEAQMRRAAKSIDPVQRKMQKLHRTVQKYGRAMKGASMQLGHFAKMGAAVGGAAAGGGLLAMVTAGFRYNKVQEDTIQNLATMNAFYKVGNKYVKDASDGAELFATNVGIARTMWQELLERQKQTPAGVNQLAELMQNSFAGIAQVNHGLDRQMDLVTSLSMLGPALANDYKQLGADTMRMLTGGAGQDVLTFRLMRNELFAAVKASGKLGKNLQNNDAFVKNFNTKLDETQKFEFMEKAMETLGPRFKKMFGESMSGLMGAARSNMSQLSGAFTTPMYLGWRNFLKRASLDKGGLMEGDSFQKFIGIAAYFGNVMGDVFTKFLTGFEKVMKFARDNWSMITDQFVLAFDIGINMLKLAIVGAIGKKAAGMFVSTVGKGMELWGKGKEMLKGLSGGAGKLANIGAMLPKILGLVALTAAAVVVGTIVAGMAAYIMSNWKKLVDSILAGWAFVEAGLIKVWVAGMQLWNALKIIGETFLGTSNGANMAIESLSIIESILKGIGHIVLIVAKGMSTLNLVVGVFRALIGKLLMDSADLMGEFGLGNSGTAMLLREMGHGFNAAAKANADSMKQWDSAVEALEEALNRPLTKRELATAKGKADDLKEWLKRLNKKDGSVPTSGVNINNQYNQWDLRNTDPDRIMSAFVPKLEQMADQRTQSYEALDQGV